MTTAAPDIHYSEFIKQLPALNKLSPDANEAATRLRAIDTILFDVLDWQKEDVDPEHYCRAEGYADYVCQVQGQKLLVTRSSSSSF